jgi:hypothetical protein
MDITKLVSFFAALSVATERITEVIKGLPGLSEWFGVDKTGTKEELRKVSVQFVAVASGTLVSYLMLDAISNQANFHAYADHKLLFSFVSGLLASGGSGVWNSALDIVREVNTQKQLVTDKMKKTS